jgi:mRNA interferase MazF
VVTPRRGEIWWAETPDDKGRPFLVLTRDAAIPVLGRLLAAPVTRTVRSIPTEVALGPAEGLPVDCAASFDNIRPVAKSALTRRIGALGRDRLPELCEAVRAALDC